MVFRDFQIPKHHIYSISGGLWICLRVVSMASALWDAESVERRCSRLVAPLPLPSLRIPTDIVGTMF